MEIPTEIIVAFLGILGIILSAFLGAFLYKGKLRKEQKAKVKSMVGESIFTSLNKYKDTIKSLKVIAPAFPEEAFNNREEDFFDSFAIVPKIMLNPQSLENFISDLSKLRTNDFDNLGLDSGATLYCLERYFMNLTKYLSPLHPDQYPLVGTIIVNDFNKFHSRITKIIYKELNKTRVKYVFHNGFFWKQKKKKYQLELWEKSILYSLIYPDKSKLPDGQKETVNLIGLALNEGVRLTNAPTAIKEPNAHVVKLQQKLNENTIKPKD
ncbi:hypothetical protein [Enterococcus gallinarum]|uniref:hypothetical protein n=1 Tax=Enterococcus gallinarum TaxID=1353 RepID=UPI0010EE5327|nr:hypothetical protein [Enterococcus gallinarum]TXW57806.1 hypothetical protein D4M64_15585 [Enterococcus gallinarum]VTS79327.1 Uncharacterised protein [Enterococcus gallinarum]DAL89324.1 MAG TPA: hypothetical protein [Caudoviricetes sp.]